MRERMAEKAKRKTPGNTVLDEGTGAMWFLAATRKHWPIVIASVLLAAGMSLLYSKSLPKVYESAAMLEFDPDAVRLMGNQTDPLRGWASFFDNREYYET